MIKIFIGIGGDALLKRGHIFIGISGEALLKRGHIFIGITEGITGDIQVNNAASVKIAWANSNDPTTIEG